MIIQNGKTYRLTQDFKNPHPDRRQKHDWRALPIVPAGTLLRGSKMRGPKDEQYASLYNGYRHRDVTAFAPEWSALVSVLEEATDEDALLFELSECYGANPEDLIKQLMKVCVVNRQQLLEAAQRQAAEEE